MTPPSLQQQQKLQRGESGVGENITSCFKSGNYFNQPLFKCEQRPKLGSAAQMCVQCKCPTCLSVLKWNACFAKICLCLAVCAPARLLTGCSLTRSDQHLHKCQNKIRDITESCLEVKLWIISLRMLMHEWSLNPNAVYYCKSKHQAHLLIKGFALLSLHNETEDMKAMKHHIELCREQKVVNKPKLLKLFVRMTALQTASLESFLLYRFHYFMKI